MAALLAALSWVATRVIATRMAEAERSVDQMVTRSAGLQIQEVASASWTAIVRNSGQPVSCQRQ